MTDTVDTHDQLALRRARLGALREAGNAFPNDFRRDTLAADLRARFQDVDAEALEGDPARVRIAGRMMTRRVMGKASFAHLLDGSGERVQIYARAPKNMLGDKLYPGKPCRVVFRRADPLTGELKVAQVLED